MNIDRAIRLVKLEREYLYKHNDAATKELRAELVEALNMAVCALKAVKQLGDIFRMMK